jgi:hypothetical protein
VDVSERRGQTPPAGATEKIPQELVDRFFDRELDEGSRERFFGMLRADLSRCAEVAKTQRLISMLREPVEAPDLSGRILDRIGERRGFLPPALRRMVKGGRLAVAACLLFGILGFAVGRRYAPDFFRLTPEEQPVTQVIESGTSEAAAVMVRPPVPPPRPAPAATPRPAPSFVRLEPGRTSVRVLPKPPGDDRLVVYQGSGGQQHFVATERIVFDQAALIRFTDLCARAPNDGLAAWFGLVHSGAGVPPVSVAAPGANACVSPGVPVRR